MWSEWYAFYEVLNDPTLITANPGVYVFAVQEVDKLIPLYVGQASNPGIRDRFTAGYRHAFTSILRRNERLHYWITWQECGVKLVGHYGKTNLDHLERDLISALDLLNWQHKRAEPPKDNKEGKDLLEHIASFSPPNTSPKVELRGKYPAELLDLVHPTRERLSLSLRGLAHRANVEYQTVRKMDGGGNNLPLLGSFFAVLNSLGLCVALGWINEVRGFQWRLCHSPTDLREGLLDRQKAEGLPDIALTDDTPSPTYSKFKRDPARTRIPTLWYFLQNAGVSITVVPYQSGMEVTPAHFS